MLFDERELLLSYDKIETVDFRQETEVEGIKFTAFNAGHVRGAAMFLIEIAGVKVEEEEEEAGCTSQHCGNSWISYNKRAFLDILHGRLFA